MAAPTFDANKGFNTTKLTAGVNNVNVFDNDFVIDTNLGNVIVNLPKVSDVIAFMQKQGSQLVNRQYIFGVDGNYGGGANTLTFVAAAGDNINGSATKVVSGAGAAFAVVGGETWLAA